jgi:hypothetical protein
MKMPWLSQCWRRLTAQAHFHAKESIDPTGFEAAAPEARAGSP